MRPSALALAASLLATPALAGPSVQLGDQINVSGVGVVGSPVTLSAPITADTIAGPIILETSVGTLVTWCMDLYHYIYLGSGQNLPYAIGGVTSTYAPGANALTALQSQELQGLATYGEQLYNSGTATNDQLAAVQIAIWSIEAPNLAYTGADSALAAADVAMAPTLTGSAVGLVALDGTQSFVTADLQVPVPETAGITILGIALLGLTAVRVLHG